MAKLDPAVRLYRAEKKKAERRRVRRLHEARQVLEDWNARNRGWLDRRSNSARRGALATHGA